MALTIVDPTDGLAPRRKSAGATQIVHAKITFDSSYPTDGEAVAPADIGLSRIISATCSHDTVGSRIVIWDQANLKLKLYTALGTEAADASNQATIVAYVLFRGV